MSVIAFHEKAGRSQVGCFVFSSDNVFSPAEFATVATLPSALFDERFSLGASWVFSFQPVLPPDYRPRFHLQDESWARRLTQSPELGFRLELFPFAERFGFMQPPASLLTC
jgi:hypothetical protein